MSTVNLFNRAVHFGNFEEALGLITPGSWLDGTDHLGETALGAAVQVKSLALVQALLDTGAKTEVRNRLGETPLHRACRLGDEAIVRALVAAGADVNARTLTNKNNIDSGQPVLIKAVIGNKLPIVTLLVEKGADPLAKDDHGNTALSIAQGGRKRIANYLAKTLATAANQAVLSMHDAVRTRSLPGLRALASQGARLDERETSSGLTPLHLAAEVAWLPGVEFLLAHGVAADVRDAHQRTPLMTIGGGKAALDIARVLLSAGADVNAQTPTGHCALASVNDAGLAKVLLEAGANPNLRHPTTGHTIFQYACLTHTADVLAAMIDAGADLDAVDGSGRGLEFYAKSNYRARALINERRGAAMSPADRLRETLKDLPKFAKAQSFVDYAAHLGAAFNRKPAPWKKRKGAVYFHEVSLARVYAYFDQPMPVTDDKSIHGAILARMAIDARNAGATLFHLEQINDAERRSFVLLPIVEPMAPAICCGTNANLRGDTNFVVDALLKIAADDPFDIYGCGLDFIDAQLRDSPRDALGLAERLINVCPDLANLQDIPGSVRSLADELADTGRFGCWWD